MRLETRPITARSFEKDYFIDGDAFERALAQVKEVTLDFSESMHIIVEACFPNAMITLDRFHHQQFCLEAVQEVRIAFRREEMTRVANERE